MTRPFLLARMRDLFPAAALLGVLLVLGCSEQAEPPTAPGPDASARPSAAAGGPQQAGPPQDLGPALAAQKAHSRALMARDDVVGTAVGLNEDGEASVVVYTVKKGVGGIPARLDDVPVETVATGLITLRSDPTTRARPAPVGYSVGHPDITAGTIGARVVDGSGNVFVLSNNHILADNNDAQLGDSALQPGPSDGGTDPEDKIGELADYETIDTSGDNTIDAAIASTTTANVGSATPTDDGYGQPSATLYALDGDGDGNVDSGVVGLNVQKYGRTTELTQGQVEEINVTVEVCIETRGPFQCATSATFVDQISISPGSFSDGGDSGSLIVTDDSNANPVGLLFAGSSTRTLANRIDLVLERFGVAIDDGSGDGGDTNSAPTASFTVSCTELTCDFDGSGSSDSDGSISSYDWDFGDGTTATGQTASHTYGSDGTYTVTLTVTDDDGATDSSSQDVSVSSSTNSAPTASFTSSCTELTCDFDGSGSSDSDGSISSYDWDFGDGNTGSGQTVTHSYASGGTYTVTLTVTDDDGATDSSSQDVTVEAATSDITLSVDGQKVRGVRTVDLSWSGTSVSEVDIYRNGSLLTTTANDGTYTDSLGRGGGGSFTYQVCEAGTSTCSNEATATF